MARCPLRAASILMGFGLFASLAPGATLAQTADPKLRLETTRQALEQRKQAEKEVAGEIGQLKSEREQLNRDLVDTARQIQKGEAQLTSIETRLGGLEEQEKLLKGSLVKRHDQIARLLAAMQRMGRNPPPVMITKREDALLMVRSAMMLATAYPELRDQALTLAGRLTELARVMGDIRTEGDRLKAETTRMNEQRTRLSMLMENKRQNQTERQGELERIRREAADIAKNVTDLNELIARLDRRITMQANPVGQPPVAAAEPAPTAAGDAAPAPLAPAPLAPAPLAPAPLAPPVAPTVVVTAPPAAQAPRGAVQVEAPKPPIVVAEVTPPTIRPTIDTTIAPKSLERPTTAIEIAPKGPQVASLNQGRLAPAVPFIQTKGKLQLPAQGRRVLAFGEKTQHGEKARGMVLETRASGQVTTPADGWVVFAGEFRSFGQLLIMNAGDGYHILLAGLSQIDVQLGEFVLAGQPVGVMSGPSRGSKAKADQSPVLYIEFRKDSRPIDPDPWWVADGLLKVQG